MNRKERAGDNAPGQLAALACIHKNHFALHSSSIRPNTLNFKVHLAYIHMKNKYISMNGPWFVYQTSLSSPPVSFRCIDLRGGQKPGCAASQSGRNTNFLLHAIGSIPVGFYPATSAQIGDHLLVHAAPVLLRPLLQRCVQFFRNIPNCHRFHANNLTPCIHSAIILKSCLL